MLAFSPASNYQLDVAKSDTLGSGCLDSTSISIERVDIHHLQNFDQSSRESEIIGIP